MSAFRWEKIVDSPYKIVALIITLIASAGAGGGWGMQSITRAELTPIRQQLAVLQDQISVLQKMVADVTLRNAVADRDTSQLMDEIARVKCILTYNIARDEWLYFAVRTGKEKPDPWPEVQCM